MNGKSVKLTATDMKSQAKRLQPMCDIYCITPRSSTLQWDVKVLNDYLIYLQWCYNIAFNIQFCMATRCINLINYFSVICLINIDFCHFIDSSPTTETWLTPFEHCASKILPHALPGDRQNSQVGEYSREVIWCSQKSVNMTHSKANELWGNI